MYLIMYHYVRNIKNSRYTGIKGLELSYFKEQIQFLQKNDFQFVSLHDILEKRNLTEKSVLLSFDDGYLDHYLNVFPILYQNGINGLFSMPGKIIREKKVLDVNKIHYVLAVSDINNIKNKLFKRLDYYRGTEFQYGSNEELYEEFAVAGRYDDRDTVFVKKMLQVELPEQLRNMLVNELFCELVSDNETAFVDELYMNMEQIHLMKKCGMTFGLHGYEHYWMNRLTDTELRNDISNALEVFEGVIDTSDWTFVYPYGSYSDQVISIAQSMGSTSGIGTDIAPYHPGTDDIYKISRLDTNDFPPKSEDYRRYEN